MLFVHHINKKAYRLSPGQEHIQGGSGLTQKTRSAIQLSEGDGNIRYFTVVKGNYCPKEYKQNSLELIFSEKTFLFANRGIMIPTSDIGTQPDNFRKKDKINELKETAQTIISDVPVSYGDFKTKTMFEDVLLFDRASRDVGQKVYIDIFKIKDLIEGSLYKNKRIVIEDDVIKLV